jgi:hypothetical protein
MDKNLFQIELEKIILIQSIKFMFVLSVHDFHMQALFILLKMLVRMWTIINLID